MPSLLTTGLWSRSYYSLSEANDEILGDLALRNNNIVKSGDIGRWLNRSQTIMARDSQAFQASFNVATVSGTAEYVLPGDSSALAVSVVEALYKNVPLWPLSTSQLYAWNVKWRSAASSTPWAYYQRGMSSIGLYPSPSSSGTTDLVVTAVVIPPKVTDPNDFFYVPVGCEDGLIAYASWKASVKDAFGEGRERIADFKAEWKHTLARACQIVREAQGQRIVRFGENGLLYDGNARFGGWWMDPNAIATHL
jgi:hypothetical protein